MIGLRTLINENCIVDDALIMGADYYETLEECALVPGCLPMGLGMEIALCMTIPAHSAICAKLHRSVTNRTCTDFHLVPVLTLVMLGASK